MTWEDLNNYLCAALAVAVISNIFWYLKWCGTQAALKNAYAYIKTLMPPEELEPMDDHVLILTNKVE